MGAFSIPPKPRRLANVSAKGRVSSKMIPAAAAAANSPLSSHRPLRIQLSRSRPDFATPPAREYIPWPRRRCPNRAALSTMTVGVDRVPQRCLVDSARLCAPRERRHRRRRRRRDVKFPRQAKAMPPRPDRSSLSSQRRLALKEMTPILCR